MLGRTYTLERRQLVPRALPEVWSFFGDPQNLEELTPNFLRFRIDTPLPIELRTGAIIDYRIRLFGLPIRWKTRIEAVEPPHRFVDLQIRGPYSLWHHEHRFEATDEGTLITDIVTYRLPLGLLGRLTHALFVQRWLRQIFDYRWQQIEERFGVAASSDDHLAVSAK